MGKRTACLFLLLFCFLVVFHSEARAEKVKPKVLFFSAIDAQYLSDTLQHWGKDAGVNGFMLAYVAQWWTPKKEMFKSLDLLKEINGKGARYGVDSNFIKIALGYKELPAWTDDRAWAEVLDNFRNIAELIRESGTRGIVIDTEPYNAELFNSKAERFKDIDRDLLRTRVYQRGMGIMKTLTEVFPDIEVIILQEGNFHWFVSRHTQYEMWPDFYNGMASVKNKKGIVLGAEGTYSLLDKESLIKRYSQTNATMQKHAQDPAFWQEKCSVAIGMWPLGKTYEDKSARYSAPDFEGQLSQAMALSPKYVWVYDHGAAWLQLNKENVQKYTVNGSISFKRQQMLPTDLKLTDYISVIRRLNTR